MLEVRRHHSLAALAPLRAEMDALSRASLRRDPFSTLAFLENYLAHDEFHPGGRGVEPWVLTAHEGNRLRGYLALRRVTDRAFGIARPKIETFGTHDVDRPGPVCAPEVEVACCRAFYEHLLASPDAWDFLEFQQQDASSPLRAALAGLDLSRYYVREFESMENCAIPIRWATLGEYHGALKKKFRGHVAQVGRALLDRGGVRLLWSDDPASTPGLLELCLSIERRSWKKPAGAGVGRDPNRVEYFRGLLGETQPMRVGIGVLMLDDIPAAAVVTGTYEGAIHALHVLFDEGARHLAPGVLMMYLAVGRAIESRARAFNLLSGFAYYKVRFLAEVNPASSLQVYRIGRPHFFKAIVGGARRYWRGTPASPRGDGAFNPARRSSGPAPDTVAGVWPPDLDPEERSRLRSLVAEALRGDVKDLSGAALAAVFPFATRPVGGADRTEPDRAPAAEEATA